MMYIKRAVEPFFLRCSAGFKAVALLGPRQVGKTTMLRHLAKEQAEQTGVERTYVTLDDADDRALAREDPKLFLQTYRPPVLIDEVQKAPALLSQLKILLDSTDEMGSVWLTGSQPLHLKARMGEESLAGRVALLEMGGLSQAELAGLPSVPFSCDDEYFSTRARGRAPVMAPDLYRSIWKGGLPGVVRADDALWAVSYSSYVDTYLLRDIREVSAIEDEGKFLRFMRACAAMTGQQVNYSELARVTDVSVPTVQRWLSLLKSSYIVRELPAYANNVIKRLSKAPVLHFSDTGLVAYLTGCLTSEMLSGGVMAGHVLETFTWGEIYKSWQATGMKPDLAFLRTQSGREVDIVFTQNGVVHPVEIKAAASPRKNDLKNFSIMSPLGDAAGTGCVLCLADAARPLDAQNWAFPIWAI